MNQDQLEAKLQAILTRDGSKKNLVHVEWRLHDEYDPKIKNINEAMRRANDGERLELSKELLGFYLSGELQSVERLFGYLPEKNDRRIMGTIAQGGRQFRIWNGLPASIYREFADSCGKNLVLHVHGEQIEQYITALLPEREGYTDFSSYDGSKIRFWRGHHR